MNYIKRLIKSIKNIGLKKTIWKILIKIKSKYLLDYSYKKKIKKIFSKDNKRVFIFAGVPYYDIGAGQRSASFANNFNNLGFEVFYIYSFPANINSLNKIKNPSVLHLSIDKFSLDDFKKYLRKSDLVIFENAEKRLLEYLLYSKKMEAKTVYESIDNWENKELGTFFYEENLKVMLKQVDLITCTAKSLITQMENYLSKFKINKTPYYLPNAVDINIFNYKNKYKKPKDLVKNEITLLYYGTLWGSWFDWDLIISLAKRNKNISINLIGEQSMLQEKIKSMPKNIYFLGPKPQRKLPNYLAHTDFAILPFNNDDIGKYVSPLKLFEYIAMNKNVIAKRLDDISGYPNVMYADTLPQWEQKLKSKTAPKKALTDEFINNNTWINRITCILNYLYPNYQNK